MKRNGFTPDDHEERDDHLLETDRECRGFGGAWADWDSAEDAIYDK